MGSFDIDSIAPYDEAKVKEAIQRLLDYPQFLNNLAECIYKGSRGSTARISSFLKKSLPDALRQIRSYDDFQKQITCRYLLPQIVMNSMDRFTFSGIDSLDPSVSYTFISNHRDIVLDCALLDYALFFGGFSNLCEMCLGDNLMVNQFSKDMFKLNGGITVMRSLPAREAMQASRILSEYMQLALENRKNIWIAQKSGRSKDGIDNTSTAVLKMIYLNYRKNGIPFNEAAKMMRIVPVSISYEYDPCDITKGREEIKKLRNEGVYSKSRYEDLLNLLRGLRKWKGNVHIAVGTVLEDEYETPLDAAREIDRQIHLNYRLWDTNYFCYDFINNSEDFVSQYEDFKERAFLHRYKGIDRDVLRYVLNSYANPVVSMLNEKKLLENR
ncbi:MAG: glycerol acyltransferase [Sphaerochaetaceae bacterium]|jgi:hypothetical protein|nr:glycerol acyltransferase [Sphaerochaetaceae bacterium]NLY07005.1 glycerol acyltransferase [Spirochaetales bacterium]